MMRRYIILLLLASWGLPLMTAEGHPQKWDVLAVRSLNGAIDDTEAFDQKSRNEILQRIAAACASCGQVNLAVIAIEKISEAPNKAFLVGVNTKFAEANPAAVTLRFGSKLKISQEEKDKMFADATTLYAEAHDFQSASEIVKQIQDLELARWAKIEMAFLSDDRQACSVAIESSVRKDIKRAKAGGGVALTWAVSEIALLRWADRKTLAEELTKELIEEFKNIDPEFNDSNFRKGVNEQFLLWEDAKKRSQLNMMKSAMPVIDEELYIKSINELLIVEKRNKPQTEKLISLVETLCKAKSHNAKRQEKPKVLSKKKVTGATNENATVKPESKSPE